MDEKIPRVKLPELPIEGGCQCGNLGYRIIAAPLTYYVCHCTDCQKQSGSAYGSSLMVPAQGIELHGPFETYACRGGSGRMSDRVFCPTCGGRVTHQIQGSDVVVVKPGTLDDTSWLKPAGHIFTASKQPWVPLPEAGALLFDHGPDMQALRDRWCRMIGGTTIS
ncbi:GFA family protein [Chelativorans alearense]|uniref:GFA family protein n=1 Tax=Chelativorans alearense TaxID=2681495 RepID=UPI0013CF4B99|nr:GFA family protein [Chelativorans alearense]